MHPATAKPASRSPGQLRKRISTSFLRIKKDGVPNAKRMLQISFQRHFVVSVGPDLTTGSIGLMPLQHKTKRLFFCKCTLSQTSLSSLESKVPSRTGRKYARNLALYRTLSIRACA